MIIVESCFFQDISFLPEKYDTEFATFSKRKKKEFWFKAMFDNNVVGCGCLLELSKKTVRLSNIFVIPSYRGRGIAQELVKERERWARANGYKFIDTRTVKLFYIKHGYEEIKKYKGGGSWLKKEL